MNMDTHRHSEGWSISIDDRASYTDLVSVWVTNPDGTAAACLTRQGMREFRDYLNKKLGEEPDTTECTTAPEPNVVNNYVTFTPPLPPISSLPISYLFDIQGYVERRARETGAM